MLSSQKLFPSSFLSHSLLPTDTGTISSAVQTIPRQKDDPSARIFRAFLSSSLINSYNGETMMTLRKEKFSHSYSINSVVLYTLDGIFQLDLAQSSLPRKTSGSDIRVMMIKLSKHKKTKEPSLFVRATIICLLRNNNKL